MGFEKPLLECLGFSLKLIAALLTLVGTWSLFVRVRNRNLPPGPFQFPVIGNLHMLGKLPHQALAVLSLKFGPLMSLRLGSTLTLVVSSPDMAKEVLKTHDKIIASRPPPLMAPKCLSYNSSNIAFAPYGPSWKQMRKVCVLQLLSSKRLDYFRFIREEEVSAMIRSIIRLDIHPVNMSKIASNLTNAIICRMTFGRKLSDDEDSIGSSRIISMLRETFLVAGSFNIGDYVPCLAWLDLQGLNRRMKKAHIMQDAFLEKIIDEHVGQNGHNVSRDLVDVLLEVSGDKDLEFPITRDNIKGVLFDMISGGTDTTSTTIEWGMSELLRNPLVMKKLQEELERVVGMERMVNEADIPFLVYLQAVAKETLRLHPPGPLTLPHAPVEACNVLGYEIPRNTAVLVNLWAIGRNPKSWEDAERFVPERFMKDGSGLDEKLKNCEWIPFGAGRRGCPGEQLAMLVLELALAQLVHCFDWRLPDGQELDMSERFDGLTVHRAQKLSCLATPRLPVLN